MRRSKYGTVALFASLALVGACSSSADDSKDGSAGNGSDPPMGTVEGEGSEGGDTAMELKLSTGSAITLPAPGDSGAISATTPVSVAFESLKCAKTFPGYGFNDSMENVDFVAEDGDQACLVELGVTNTGKKPNFFGSGNGSSNMLVTDGAEYSETSQDYDDQGIAASKKRQPSNTADMIQPGQTKYDYVIYEIPDSAQPASLVYNITTAD